MSKMPCSENEKAFKVFLGSYAISMQTRLFDFSKTLKLKNKLTSETLPRWAGKADDSGCSHFFLEFLRSGESKGAVMKGRVRGPVIPLHLEDIYLK